MDTVYGQKQAVLNFRKAFKAAPWIPISQMQSQSFHDRPLKGPILRSKVKIPCPRKDEEVSLRSKLWELYISKCEGVEQLDAPAPCSEYLGEWIGVRKDVKDGKAPQPNWTEYEKFKEIQTNAPGDVTLFHITGGAWFRAGPPNSRPLIKQLCEYSGSHAFTFQYRLAPQYTLPTILLDVIVAYFYLVAPPAGSFHSPVDPKSIILTGESGGAVLHLGLLQFLQFLRRSESTSGSREPTIHFNGRDIPITMPNGCALFSPAADLALSLPSVKKFETIDWLSEGAPWTQRKFPADKIWPASPPRGDLHCDNSALCHPLIDPATWTDWEGMPPMWFACGQETYADGIKFLVKNIAASGIPVIFVEYEFMPHYWAVVMPFLPQSQHSIKLWGEACKKLGDGNIKKGESKAYFVKLGGLEMVSQSIHGLLDIPRDEVLECMRAARDKLAKFVWKGPEVGYSKL